jgi:hypothetical protein
MSNPSDPAPRRKTPDRPKKPYSEFPLAPHPRGGWVKNIRGRVYYFGKWARTVDGKLERVPGDGYAGACGECGPRPTDH